MECITYKFRPSRLLIDRSNFVPGINHLLYSSFPYLTARKALQARSRIIDAFKSYFEDAGHLQAFPMVSEMYEANKKYGLTSDEAAKMEMATSLAMLSSGANTALWLLCQTFSNHHTLDTIRHGLYQVTTNDLHRGAAEGQILDLNQLRTHCLTLVAMLHETFRFHSTVINIKQVQHDTKLTDQYLLKKNAINMIPDQSIHYDKDTWGPRADCFDHLRFLTPNNKKNLSNTSTFQSFGAGATMCPGRHFSTNIILSLVAMIVLQYDVVRMQRQWATPTKRNADIWNAMPKPDWDVNVKLVRRADDQGVQWEFVWTDEDQGE